MFKFETIILVVFALALFIYGSASFEFVIDEVNQTAKKILKTQRTPDVPGDISEIPKKLREDETKALKEASRYSTKVDVYPTQDMSLFEKFFNIKRCPVK